MGEQYVPLPPMRTSPRVHESWDAPMAQCEACTVHRDLQTGQVSVSSGFEASPSM